MNLAMPSRTARSLASAPVASSSSRPPRAVAAAPSARLSPTSAFSLLPSSESRASTRVPRAHRSFPRPFSLRQRRGAPQDSARIAARTVVAVARPNSSAYGSSSPSSPAKILTVPTLLTLSRVAAVPLLVYLWFASPPKRAPLRLAAVFAAASLTDAVDGHLARSTGQCTPFGAFLDPVADKLMVCTALVLVVSRGASASAVAGFAPWVVPAAVSAIVGREVAMSALREWAAGTGSDGAKTAAAVSWAGKLKTAAQMVAVSALLVASCRPCCAPSAGTFARSLHDAACAVGVPALVLSSALAVASFGQYLVALWPWLSGARVD